MRRVQTVMGLPMSIDVRDPGDHTAAADAAFGALRAADERFSTYRPDSELSRINRRGGDLDSASDDMLEVIAIGQSASLDSGGAFRVRRPDGTWDLDGVVKGWAASRAASELEDSGVGRFCLNAGGDVIVAGSPDPGREWNIAVRSPDSPTAVLAVLSLTDQAVATSGAYERGEHIVDGRTHEPARGLRSATVVADDLTTADVLATAVFAMGVEGVAWAAARGATGVLAVHDDGRLMGAGSLRFAAGDTSRLRR